MNVSFKSYSYYAYVYAYTYVCTIKLRCKTDEYNFEFYNHLLGLNCGISSSFKSPKTHYIAIRGTAGI